MKLKDTEPWLNVEKYINDDLSSYIYGVFFCVLSLYYTADVYVLNIRLSTTW